MKPIVVAALLAAFVTTAPATARAGNNNNNDNANCAFSGWNTTFVWGTGISALDCYGAVGGNTDGAADRIRLLGELEVEFDLNGASAALNGWSEPSPYATWNTSNATMTFSQFVRQSLNRNISLCRSIEEEVARQNFQAAAGR